MPLTDIAIRNAKPKEQAHRLFDGGGLFLFVTPPGAASGDLRIISPGR